MPRRVLTPKVTNVDTPLPSCEAQPSSCPLRPRVAKRPDSWTDPQRRIAARIGSLSKSHSVDPGRRSSGEQVTSVHTRLLATALNARPGFLPQQFDAGRGSGETEKVHHTEPRSFNADQCGTVRPALAKRFWMGDIFAHACRSPARGRPSCWGSEPKSRLLKLGRLWSVALPGARRGTTLL